MAKFDELDQILFRNPINHSSWLSDEDWESLAESLEIPVEKLPAYQLARRSLINKEFRHSYGHTFLNFFRDEYSPDYSTIVYDCAEQLELVLPDDSTLEEVEDRILIELVKKTKAKIDSSDEMNWQSIENKALLELHRLDPNVLTDGVLQEFEDIKPGTLTDLIIDGKLPGFSLYIAINHLINATILYEQNIWNKVFAVTSIVAAPTASILGRVIMTGASRALGVLGPIGATASAVWVGYDLGNTNWKRVFKTIPQIIMFRRWFTFEEVKSNANSLLMKDLYRKDTFGSLKDEDIYDENMNIAPLKDSINRSYLEKSCYLFNIGFREYLVQRLEEKLGKEWILRLLEERTWQQRDIDDPDFSATIRAGLKYWYILESIGLTDEHKSMIKELRKMRNKWAHPGRKKRISNDDVNMSIQTCLEVMRIIRCSKLIIAFSVMQKKYQQEHT